MIPALAFNNANSPIHMDAVRVGEIIAAGSRKLNEFSSLTSGHNFQTKNTFIKINNLSINSGSTNGVHLEVESLRGCDLIIPLVGQNHTTIEGCKFSYGSNNKCLLGIYENHKTKSVGSVAVIRFQTDRLVQTGSAIFGSYCSSALPVTSQLLSTESAGISFLQLFKGLFSQIDAANCDANIVSKMALDDSFYRLCAGLIHPEIFLTDETHNGKRPHVRPEINRLCEYVAAHLNEAISLTDMEGMSGLSARILQRSFQNVFGVTPKQWVRKQRLHAAREVMLKKREPISVTALAYEFCFSSPSDFAYHYSLEFGEQPSYTLGRRKFTVVAKSSVDFEK